MDFTKNDDPFVAKRSKQELDVVLKEINENPNEVESTLKDFKAWLDAQKHFTVPADKILLMNFLRMSKWDVGKAKRLVETFCRFQCQSTTRSWMLHSSKDVDEKLLDFFKDGTSLTLPKRNPKDGCRIIIIRVGNWDIDKHGLEPGLKALDWESKIRMLDYTPALNGLIYIYDLSGLGIKQLKYFTPNFLKTYTQYLHEALPSRVKAYHMIHMPMVARGALELYKMLCSEKVQNRIYLYGSDLSELLQRVDPSCLPSEYGGTAGTHAQLLEKSIAFRRQNINQLDKYEALEYDAALKPAAGQTSMGTEGTFRKLQN